MRILRDARGFLRQVLRVAKSLCLDCMLLAGLSLSARLVEADCGGGGDIEGIGLSRHRDEDGLSGRLNPVIGEARLFAAKEEGGGLGEITVPVRDAGGGGGGAGLNLVLGEPLGEGVALGGHKGKGKEESLRGANGVGIVEIEDAVDKDDGIGAGAIGGTKDRAEIAGFFNALEDEEEGVLGELECFEGVALLVTDRDDAIGAFALGGFIEGFGAEAD